MLWKGPKSFGNPEGICWTGCCWKFVVVGLLKRAKIESFDILEESIPTASSPPLDP